MRFDNLKVKDIEFILKYTPTNRRFSAQNRTNHIVGIQYTGSAVHHFQNGDKLLEDGMVYFLNQKDPYDVDVVQFGVAFSVHFTTAEPIETDSFFAKSGSGADEIFRLLESLDKQYRSKSGELRLLSDFYRLCDTVNSLYRKGFSPCDRRMLKARAYLNEHFTEKDCLFVAAANSNLTRRHFNDLFKSCFGITPNRYLVGLKIKYAQKLLSTDYLTVTQIAEMCGFSELAYFSKVFKAELSASPAEYRKALFRTESK